MIKGCTSKCDLTSLDITSEDLQVDSSPSLASLHYTRDSELMKMWRKTIG